MKKRTILLAIVLCLSLTACQQEKEERLPPSRSTDPIMNITTPPPSSGEIHTPVYVTVFGDTAYLATFPKVTGDEGEEPVCPARQISDGLPISCGGAHEKEIPITCVVIMDELYPYSTANWFRNMTALRTIKGQKNLHIENVTDMSNMFNGCTRLAELEIESWDVSNVTDMTDMFKDCNALETLPSWYKE